MLTLVVDNQRVLLLIPEVDALLSSTTTPLLFYESCEASGTGRWNVSLDLYFVVEIKDGL